MKGIYMNSVKKICLSCKYFRLRNVAEGICRVDRDTNKEYPVKQKTDGCGNWQNCGQQYYIRLG